MRDRCFNLPDPIRRTVADVREALDMPSGACGWLWLGWMLLALAAILVGVPALLLAFA